MFKNLTILALIFLSFFSSCAQQGMADYIGKWEGETENKNAFNLDITIKKGINGNSIFVLSNEKEIINKKFVFDNRINLVLDDGFAFSGIVNDEQSEINGLIKSNGYFYPVELYKESGNFKGKWNLTAFQYLQSKTLFLTIKEGNSPNDEYAAYPILGSLWCNNFKKRNDTISFTDYFTGLKFKGTLKASEIILKVSLGENVITQLSYKRTKDNIKLSNTRNYQLNDGWKSSDISLILPEMEGDILNNTLEGTEGVLIAKNGEIIYENYFNGFNATTPHDLRSASKSISSAMIGIAIDDEIIESVEEVFYDFIPEKYLYTKDSTKSKITLKDLLTMSSGINVSEGQYQESNNWLKTVLKPPLKHEPGTVTDYKSADPYLTGIYLKERLEIPLEFYMVDKLFSPLNITNYIINTDDTKESPYFGGGLHLTPRDMLKFGQLYLDKGIWNGKRVISEKWVNDSFKKYTHLEDVSDKNEYGYFWWHNTYSINGKKIESIEARGAGGQYIFVIPELDSVVVITSGNYRNGKTRQPEKIVKKYILTAITN